MLEDGPAFLQLSSKSFTKSSCELTISTVPYIRHVECFMAYSWVWRMIWTDIGCRLQTDRTLCASCQYMVVSFRVDNLCTLHTNLCTIMASWYMSNRFFEKVHHIDGVTGFTVQILMSLYDYLLDPHIGGTGLHVQWSDRICRSMGNSSGSLSHNVYPR